MGACGAFYAAGLYHPRPSGSSNSPFGFLRGIPGGNIQNRPLHPFHFSKGRGIIPVRAASRRRCLVCNHSEKVRIKTMNELLKAVEASDNPNIPELNAGDTVSVFLRIKEGNTERTQEFRGTVLGVRGGGNNASFTVRRVASNGIGVERTFLLRSPRLERVVVHRSAYVRRSKLFFLRERTGK